jgi:enamine deaminase RidA (YjgF/YER057c/UK114 family)
MTGVHREYFPSESLARTAVGTTALANPAMMIEIEAVALAPDGYPACFAIR